MLRFRTLFEKRRNRKYRKKKDNSPSEQKSTLLRTNWMCKPIKQLRKVRIKTEESTVWPLPSKETAKPTTIESTNSTKTSTPLKAN